MNRNIKATAYCLALMTSMSFLLSSDNKYRSMALPSIRAERETFEPKVSTNPMPMPNIIIPDSSEEISNYDFFKSREHQYIISNSSSSTDIYHASCFSYLFNVTKDSFDLLSYNHDLDSLSSITYEMSSVNRNWSTIDEFVETLEYIGKSAYKSAPTVLGKNSLDYAYVGELDSSKASNTNIVLFKNRDHIVLYSSDTDKEKLISNGVEEEYSRIQILSRPYMSDWVLSETYATEYDDKEYLKTILLEQADFTNRLAETNREKSYIKLL